MNLRCLIVEDNKVVRLTLINFLKNLPDVTVVGECEDGLTCRKMLETEEVDILFLDVQLPGVNGMELLKSLPVPPLTIMITSEAQYAVEAYELNVIDYILKPFTAARLLQSLNRAKELLKNRVLSLKEDLSKSYLFLKDKKVIRKINLDDLLWIESKGDFVHLKTTKNSHIIHNTLKAIEEKLNNQKFVRTHRKFIVNVEKIDCLENGLACINNEFIPVSGNYKDQLLHAGNTI